MAELSPRQRAFIEYYLVSWNATDAAIKAGYSPATAYSQGSRLLKNVEIKDALKEYLGPRHMTAEEVVMHLTEQGRGSIEDIGEIGAQGSFVVDLNKAKKLGRLGNIKKIKPTRYGYEIELYDKQGALEKLGRVHGIFTDKTQITGADGEPLFKSYRNVDTDAV